MAKTVIVKGTNFTRKEAFASEAIMPGTFVARIVAGEVALRDGTVALKDSANLIVMENEVVGNDITTAYADLDTILLAAVGPGTEVNALIPSGQDIDVGEALEMNASGELITSAGTNIIVAVSLEDTGGALGADAHVLVEIV